MSGVTFQPHSSYSVDVARAWRTDDVGQDTLKGAVEDSRESGKETIAREPSRKLITPDDKEHVVTHTSNSSSSSSSSSSASSTVPSDALALILSRMDTMSTQMDRMERSLIIQNKQITSLVNMSCPDKLLSMILCGYTKIVRDKTLTDAEKAFLAQSQRPEVEDGTH